MLTTTCMVNLAWSYQTPSQTLAWWIMAAVSSHITVSLEVSSLVTSSLLMSKLVSNGLTMSSFTVRSLMVSLAVRRLTSKYVLHILVVHIMQFIQLSIE